MHYCIYIYYIVSTDEFHFSCAFFQVQLFRAVAALIPLESQQRAPALLFFYRLQYLYLCVENSLEVYYLSHATWNRVSHFWKCTLLPHTWWYWMLHWCKLEKVQSYKDLRQSKTDLPLIILLAGHHSKVCTVEQTVQEGEQTKIPSMPEAWKLFFFWKFCNRLCKLASLILKSNFSFIAKASWTEGYWISTTSIL